eukprot:268926_1
MQLFLLYFNCFLIGLDLKRRQIANNIKFSLTATKLPSLFCQTSTLFTNPLLFSTKLPVLIKAINDMFSLLAFCAFLLYQPIPMHGIGHEIIWDDGDYPLPEPISDGGIFSFEHPYNWAYLFGGYDGTSWLNTIYKLDTSFATPEWQLISTTIPVTSISISQRASVAVGNKIYFYTSGAFLIFDIFSTQFIDNTNITPNPIPATYSSLSTDGINYIYVTGAGNDISRIMRYDINNNEWELIDNNAPHKWWNLDTIYYAPQNRIYIFGGAAPDSFPETYYFKGIYYYDLNNNEWINEIATKPVATLSNSLLFNIDGDDIIFIIEYSSLGKVNSFNPETSFLTQETSRDYLKCGQGTAAMIFKSRIQLFGGRNAALNNPTGHHPAAYHDENCRTQEF